MEAPVAERLSRCQSYSFARMDFEKNSGLHEEAFSSKRKVIIYRAESSLDALPWLKDCEHHAYSQFSKMWGLCVASKMVSI